MDKTIRVLHVLQRMEAGGTQALLINLYRNIDRTKVQFDFFVEYDYKEFYDDEIVSLGGKVFYSNVRRDFNILRFEKQLEKVIKEGNYKIVHVHSYSLGYFVLKVAKKCGVPVRIAHSHNNETVRDSKYILKLLMQKIYTIHATDLFACSESAGKYLFGEKKFKVLNNSIDTKKFIFDKKISDKIKRELNIENCFVVGHVGRLHAQKNHKFLINVFNEIKKKEPTSKLILIGSGPLEDEIKKQVTNLKLENDVLFLGVRKNINEILMAMDVFVLPSLFEGLGIVAIEAQAAGLPVVSSLGIANEANVTKNIVKIGLDRPIEEWVEAIINTPTIDKVSVFDEIKKSGYDIGENAKIIENFYIKKYNSISKK